jgi:hypothetical protein
MAGLSPGQSPPPVNTPIFILHLHQIYSRNTKFTEKICDKREDRIQVFEELINLSFISPSTP